MPEAFILQLPFRQNQLCQVKKGFYHWRIDDGLVEGISLVGMDSENAKVSIRSDEKYSYIGSDGKEKILTGDEILKALEGKAKGESKDLAATKNKAR